MFVSFFDVQNYEKPVKNRKLPPVFNKRCSFLAKPHFFCFFHKQLHERLTLVGHFVIEHGIFESLFERAHLARGLEVEQLHDLVAVYYGL